MKFWRIIWFLWNTLMTVENQQRVTRSTPMEVLMELQHFVQVTGVIWQWCPMQSDLSYHGNGHGCHKSGRKRNGTRHRGLECLKMHTIGAHDWTNPKSKYPEKQSKRNLQLGNTTQLISSIISLVFVVQDTYKRSLHCQWATLFK